jgi:hypothetical protein
MTEHVSAKDRHETRIRKAQTIGVTETHQLAALRRDIAGRLINVESYQLPMCRVGSVVRIRQKNQWFGSDFLPRKPAWEASGKMRVRPRELYDPAASRPLWPVACVRARDEM